MWTETDFATTQDETTFDAREQFMGTFVAGCGWRKVTSLCRLVTNPDLEPLIFSRSATFLSLKRTPAPSDQRRAVASAFLSLTTHERNR